MNGGILRLFYLHLLKKMFGFLEEEKDGKEK
jgi:hypothetical protein